MTRDLCHTTCLAPVLALFILSACSRTHPVLEPRPGSAVTTIDGAGVPTPLPPRPAPTGMSDPGIVEVDLDALWARQLMVPLDGLTRDAVSDNYSGLRGTREHRALDFLANRGTPVLAADDQVIGRLATTPLGGIIVYASDLTARFVYYYAHLDRYRDGLSVGDTVAKGVVIGYVGSTGNANPDAPHLHFQVMKRGTGRAWWDGPAIDPYPFFAVDGRQR